MQPSCDKIINVEVILQLNDSAQINLTERSVGLDSRNMSTYDENHMLNDMACEVEFPDGQIRAHSSKILVKNMLTWVDEYDFSTTPLDAIIDNKKEESALDMKKKYIMSSNGQKVFVLSDGS